MKCAEPDCGGIVVDGYCELCGTAPAPDAPAASQPVSTATAASGEASFAQRGSGPGSEPEVKNTMSIISTHQVVALITAHTNERAIFYPPFDLNAGDTPELNTGYKALAQAMLAATNNGYTNTRDSAHDYETSGETNDWSYYATRGFGFTQELIGPVAGCPQALPNYLNCTTADFTGHAGPTSTAAQTNTFEGHPVRDAWWTVLVVRVAARRALGDHRHRRPGRDAEDHEGLHALHRAGQAEHDAGHRAPGRSPLRIR